MSRLTGQFARRVLASTSATALVATGVVVAAPPVSALASCPTSTPAIGELVTCDIPGLDSITVPGGATRVYLDVDGAGGGGAAPDAASAAVGGSGANVRATVIGLSGITSLAVTVGAAGVGGSPIAIRGGHGGASSGVATNGGTDLVIAGGGGGASTSTGVSGGNAGESTTESGGNGLGVAGFSYVAEGGKGGSGVALGVGGLGGGTLAMSPLSGADGEPGATYVTEGGGVAGALPVENLGGLGNGNGGGGSGYGGGGSGGKVSNGTVGAGGAGGSYYAPGLADATISSGLPGGGSAVSGGEAGATGTVRFRFSSESAPAFTAQSPETSAATGAPYSYTFIATGQPSPVFAVASGSLPPGLALNASTGLLSGTPTTAGEFTFRVSATNGIDPATESASITINVASGAVCSLTIIKPRPMSRKLPIGKKVTLVKRMKTAPQCSLKVTTRARTLSARGDLRAALKFIVNRKTGKVKAVARRGNAKARVTAVAIPVAAPYSTRSVRWKRTWTS
ncbi:MAG: putative Ig domain-containing protein [Actinobacteria bacterium]|nr:putative Ig domain-containing protein [Actinomycetota bacterium]